MATRTVKTSGGDYTTLAAAWAASSGGDTIEVYAGDYTAAGTQTLSGKSLSSGSRITIVAADGEGFSGDCGGTFPKFSNIEVSNEWVDISGFVCVGTGSYSESAWIITQPNCTIDRCGAWNLIYSGTYQAFKAGFGFSYTIGTVVARLCCVCGITVVTTASKGSYAKGFANNGLGTLNLLHCSTQGIGITNTAYPASASAYGLDHYGAGTTNCYNCAFGTCTSSGTAAPTYVAGGTLTASHNAGYTTVAHGSSNQTFTPATTFTDVNTATMDLHLLDGTSDLVGNAGDISGVTGYPTTDIDGDTLDYDGGGDIGCDTWVASGPPAGSSWYAYAQQ